MIIGHYKILLLWLIIRSKPHSLNIRAVSELVIVVSVRSQVVCLTDIKRVSQHQVTEAPQGICHSGMGSFALQPVSWQPALLLFGEVSITLLSCYGNTGVLIIVLNQNKKYFIAPYRGNWILLLHQE